MVNDIDDFMSKPEVESVEEVDWIKESYWSLSQSLEDIHILKHDSIHRDVQNLSLPPNQTLKLLSKASKTFTVTPDSTEVSDASTPTLIYKDTTYTPLTFKQTIQESACFEALKFQNCNLPKLDSPSFSFSEPKTKILIIDNCKINKESLEALLRCLNESTLPLDEVNVFPEIEVDAEALGLWFELTHE